MRLNARKPVLGGGGGGGGGVANNRGADQPVHPLISFFESIISRLAVS